ncbi:MAG: hypothetical protein K0R67_2552 [Paenibacillus sp.]|nr:hypothetical protein [Paenibacillus sp.]
MQIGQMLRGLMGDAQVGDAKSLELKIGQIVKGMVLQLLGEQEAVVNIGGVHVRAKLETPLQQGQVTLLQVQPNSNSDQMILKPVSSPDVALTDESLSDIVKGFGLKDQPATRELVKQMQQAGVPLNRANVQQIQNVLDQIPPAASTEEWTETSIVAMKRNLPVTPATIGALHQVIFGKPFAEELAQLSSKLSEALQPQKSGGAELPPAAREAAGKLLALLGGLADSARSVAASASEPPPAASAQARGSAAAAGEARALQPAPGGAPAAGAAAPSAAASPAASALGRGADAPAPAAQPPGEAQRPAASDAPRASSASAAGSAAAEPAPAKPAAAPEWIPRLLRAVGVEHEHIVAKSLIREADSGPLMKLGGSEFNNLPVGLLEAQEGPDNAAQKPFTDTLKSLLLQLADTDGLPPAVKEQVQQALQNVTGQQLLLSPDRNAVFTHVTLFIPFHNGEGEQTASIHVQSRKGKKGEIDAQNCRLLFDLRMKSIGDTLIDVQVYDRMVQLQVHNDHPFMGGLVETYRREIEEGLANSGYTLVSLRCAPFPELGPAAEGTMKDESAERNSKPSAAAAYHIKPYRGVDIRV